MQDFHFSGASSKDSLCPVMGWPAGIVPDQNTSACPRKEKKGPTQGFWPPIKILCCSKLNWKHRSRLLTTPPSLAGMNWLKHKWEQQLGRDVQSTDVREENVFRISPPNPPLGRVSSSTYSPKFGAMWTNWQADGMSLRWVKLQHKMFTPVFRRLRK